VSTRNASGLLRRVGFCRSLSGQSAVELAIVAPVLILMLLAAADFGRVFYLSVEVNNAARTGVQYGAQNSGDASDTGPTGKIVQAAKSDATDISGFSATASEFCQCPAGTSSVSTVACPTGTDPPPCSDMRIYVKVDTAATFNTIVSWPGIPSPVVVNGSAQMREQ